MSFKRILTMKVLVDEMYDGFDARLKEFGYEAFSVKKLIAEGKKLSSDYSVIKYAHENGMIVVTEDVEIGNACKENDIRCVLLDSETIFQIILEELSKHKDR
ncbi:conserved protein of unknown function [Candidatus Nitrosotalea okcheonensis]|uniref:DUF5615 domain-containing protein n=2 Tax=Candidatus Nitrosotalea okcheonensis TaxID=1903276 RepID=A0A2H1FCU0_9ARCH|nr:conserved protein of unknown function [Candidatus Nitrosotalea okcheonensis]